MEPVHATAWALGALGAGAAMARRAQMNRRLRAFRAAVAQGTVTPQQLADVARWGPGWFYEATRTLVQEHRLADAAALLRARPPGRRRGAVHAMQLVHALLGLGRVAEARELVDGIAGLTVNGRELRVYLDARVRIAAGDAATVARLPLEPEDGAHPAWAAYRHLARADAAAALGDREAARRLLSALPEPGRTRALETLRDSDRPSAPLAAELLAGAVMPYR